MRAKNVGKALPIFGTLLAVLAVAATSSWAQKPPEELDRSKLKDSFFYYGPNGLWWKWTPDQKLGRDTWFFYTGRNQKFYRILAEFGGQNGISIDFFRLLATDPTRRFREVGLINEPNFQGKVVDEYGFTIDRWLGDPIPEAYPKDPELYGEPTGVIGLRKFKNPAFSAQNEVQWKADPRAAVRRYFANPGKVQPPYTLGITCSFCHVAFDPLNPPADPVKPRWENLAANMGNQYLREGDLFFGPGRVVGGDANPGANYPNDPYDTRGLSDSSFLYQYGHTQQPGTSETSRFSYDFINNPNTINQIFNLGGRPLFFETAPSGKAQLTNHVLKDGSDSIGILAALMRVYINIGSEGDYWADHLWNPASGMTQKPFSIEEVRLAGGLMAPANPAQAARKQALVAAYPDLGRAWAETERRVPFLASYLASYTPYSLGSIKGPDGKPKYITQDKDLLVKGAALFADHCATCHSNKQPFYPLSSDEDRKRYFREIVLSDQFAPGNTFSDDVRYPFNYPGFGINSARAMATNAIDGDIWAEFSSKDYKALPPLGYMTFDNPVGAGGASITTSYTAPGGGRGYYRTAALNSMWATAPYLHNNSIGAPPLDAQGLIDPKACTVEGRLALFEDAMDQMLNPSKRVPMVKRTSAESGLATGLPQLERLIAGLAAGAAKQVLEQVFDDAAKEFAAQFALPAGVQAKLDESVREIKSRFAPEIGAIHSAEQFAASKLALLGKLAGHVDAVAQEKLTDNPAAAAALGKLKARFNQAVETRLDNLNDLVASGFNIPKGTPTNLILNLRIDKAPYALVILLKHKSDPGKLAEELLKISECPDLVENRGHVFGANLSADDKRALIEFLKTL